MTSDQEPIKVIRADVFLDFAQNAEATIEVLSSEIPIDSPRRHEIENALKQLRGYIQKLRESIE
jgi:hypothetical protein